MRKINNASKYRCVLHVVRASSLASFSKVALVVKAHIQMNSIYFGKLHESH